MKKKTLWPKILKALAAAITAVLGILGEVTYCPDGRTDGKKERG